MDTTSYSFEDWVNTGKIALKMGDKNSAARCFQRAARINAIDDEIWVLLAEAVEEPKESQIYLERALTLNPQNERARHVLAWVHSQLVSDPSSIAVIERMGEQKSDPGDRLSTGPLLVCPTCQQPVSTHDTVCIYCDTVLTMKCRRCGLPVDPKVNICATCGYDSSLQSGAMTSVLPETLDTAGHAVDIDWQLKPLRPHVEEKVEPVEILPDTSGVDWGIRKLVMPNYPPAKKRGWFSFLLVLLLMLVLAVAIVAALSVWGVVSLSIG